MATTLTILLLCFGGWHAVVILFVKNRLTWDDDLISAFMFCREALKALTLVLVTRVLFNDVGSGWRSDCRSVLFGLTMCMVAYAIYAVAEVGTW